MEQMLNVDGAVPGFLRSNPMGCFAVSAGGVISDLNAAGARLLGKSRDELLNRRLEHFVTAAFIGDFREFLERSCQGTADFTLIVAFKTDNTATVPAGLSGSPGSSTGSCLIMAMDLSFRPDQKAANHPYVSAAGQPMMDDVFQIANLNKAILDNAGFTIITTTPNGIIQSINPAGLAMLGYAAGEVIGKLKPLSFHDKEEITKVYRELTGRVEGSESEIFATIQEGMYHKTTEWRYQTKSGRKFPVKINLSSYNNPDGTVGGYIGLIMDITQEKKAMDSLRESEERFHRMFHEHSAVMLLVDPESEEIVDANQAAERFYGYSFSAGERMKITTINTLSPEDLKREMAKATLKQCNCFNFKHKLASGDIRSVEVHSTPIEVNGVRVLFSIIHDITERKHIELFQDQLLQLSVNLTGIPAHEIRASINLALQEIGTFLEADRAYIFTLDYVEQTMSNTYEWCQTGISPEIENLQDIPISIFPEWMATLERYEVVHIPLVKELPATWQAEREILEPQGVQSLIVVPLIQDNELIGFAGLDSVRKKRTYIPREITMLQVFTNILASVFNHEKNATRIQLSEEKFAKAFNSNSVLMAILSFEDVFLEVNETFLSTLGYTRPEVIGKTSRELALFDDPAARRPILEKLMQDIPSSEIELPIRTKSRKLLVGLFSAQLIRIGTEQCVLTTMVDITRKSQVEEALKKSESENRAIINAVPDLLFRIRRDGTFLETHSLNEADLLFPQVQFLGKKISEVLPPDLSQQSMDAIGHALSTGTIARYEYEIPINGVIGYFENRMIAISKDEVLSIIRDISDRRTAEIDLQEAIRKLTNLIQNIQAGTLFEDHNRRITLVNESFCRLFGIPAAPEQLIGYDCELAAENSKLLMKDPEGFLARIGELLKDGKIVVNDEIQLLDGRVFERDYIPIRNGDSLVGNLWQYRDITERIKLYQELTLEKRRLDDIIKGTNAGTWEWNVQTGETIFNDQWAEMIGYTLEEISPVSIETWTSFAHTEDLIRSGELLEKHFSGELSYYAFEGRMKHKNGSWIWVLDRGRVHEWDPDGKPLLMSGTHQDITERKHSEEELFKAKMAADKANQAKSEFLSRMSHELRTPMNSILGFAQLMEMGELKPSHKKGVGHILNNGRHLLSLINEVLDISGIEAGRETLAIEPVLLNDLIINLMDIVQVVASKKSVLITYPGAQAGRISVLADQRRLKQALLNLLNNAVKYNHPGGSIIIETGIQPVNAAGKRLVRISIRDTGPGIKPEHLGKLFQPFERIGAEKTEIEGTGLGLMVMKKLTEAMGGVVGVESEYGNGSVFWIEIPLCERFPTTCTESSENPDLKIETMSQAISILYIEDNLSNIELVEDILEEHRPALKLLTATEGKQALRLAQRLKPGLILLDLDLPDLPGIEVLQLLLADSLTNSIPVIIISADGMPKKIELLMKAGAADYLIKPLDVIHFLKVVDQYVSNLTQINKTK